MKNDVAVKKITIKMGEQETELTLEQARELQDVLANLLGIKKEKENVYIDRPYPYPVIQPYVYRPYRYLKVYPGWDVNTPGTVPGWTTVGINNTNNTNSGNTNLISNNGSYLITIS